MILQMSRRLTLLALIGLMAIHAADLSYKQTVEAWRAQRLDELKKDDGWLTLAGLSWLKDGPNRCGSDAAADVILPAESAPANVGLFDFHDGKATFTAAPGVIANLNGKSSPPAILQTDDKGAPDIITIGSVSMLVIKRGDRYGIRVKDTRSKSRREFRGLHWYPVKPAYLVTAKFVAAPAELMVPNVLGHVDKMPSPGYVTFELNGSQIRLDPTVEGDALFFVFKDLTSGKGTYGAGRFLHTPLPKNGKVLLDFNEAYNPPCAFTPFATCPLPPKNNRLKIAIEAGELKYAH